MHLVSSARMYRSNSSDYSMHIHDRASRQQTGTRACSITYEDGIAGAAEIQSATGKNDGKNSGIPIEAL
jgi:hypothetical protein